MSPESGNAAGTASATIPDVDTKIADRNYGDTFGSSEQCRI
jgi:hypothetical protein